MRHGTDAEMGVVLVELLCALRHGAGVELLRHGAGAELVVVPCCCVC